MRRDWNRLLKVLIASEEFLVGTGYQPVSIKSLPFVHTARRSYRWNDPANNSDTCESQLIGKALEIVVNLIT